MEDEAVRSLVLKNSDDEVMTYVSHRVLDETRQGVMATAFPDCSLGAKVIAITAKDGGGAAKEFIAVVKESGPTVLTGCCQITYEDLSPSDCMEYGFAEAPGQWAMAQLSLDALETYRGMKFEAWTHMLLNPTCEAQFRRMLQIGLVCQLYDPHVFPTPDAFKSKYQVTDERTGKLIDLPHPIDELRVWDAEKMVYRVIDTHLKGAPLEAEKAAWWTSFVKELSVKHGEEYIIGLMNGK